MTIYLAQTFVLFCSALTLAPLAIACIAQALRLHERNQRNALANAYPLCAGIDGLATAMQAQAVALPESQGCLGVQRYTGKIMPYGIARVCTFWAMLAALAWILKDPSILSLAGGIFWPVLKDSKDGELSARNEDTFSEDREDFVNHYLNKERAQSVEFKALFDYPELLIKAERARKDIMELESDYEANESAIVDAWCTIGYLARVAKYNDIRREIEDEIEETCVNHDTVPQVPRYRESAQGKEILYAMDGHESQGWVMHESNVDALQALFPWEWEDYSVVIDLDGLSLGELRTLRDITNALTQHPCIDEDSYYKLQFDYCVNYVDKLGLDWFKDLSERGREKIAAQYS